MIVAHSLNPLGVKKLSLIEALLFFLILQETVIAANLCVLVIVGFEDRFQREATLCSSAVRPSLVKVSYCYSSIDSLAFF